MRRVAFVTQKGGSGKSTLAVCLAVAAREAGERVFLIDLDPLQSLSGWARTRETNDIPVVATPASKLEKVLDELAARGVTLVVIDSPGGDGAAFDAAIKAAQFCLIPARPNAFDLAAGERTLKKLKQLQRDYAFVLNQCPTSRQNARVEEGVATLEALGVLMTPLIASRVDYQEAARRGLGVTEVNPNGAAAEEIRALWASVRKRLGRKARKLAA
ncbi:ATPase [Rhodoblastus sphagnicola]|uniref:ATPase n=1 Tax=Rhodoblastus sphagnicola TaxID=333368 RepID=A0A2S6MVL9_9HYPH|nr:ParA family protein [Rhodoblastus sphagnicola]MBB4198374.1 chromosome partitioning protein [Rhodoblastus sphagnicola]PPQ26413.1 ATPase [Rhodoblastus sphagnicola]